MHGTQAGAGFFGAPRRTEEDARLAPSHAPGAFTDPIPATISSDDRMGDMGSDDGAAYLIGRLIPLHPVTQYEGATQLSVGERVVGRESALCLGLSRVAPLRA